VPAGYAGPPDPEKGTPYRHTRQKITLMLEPILDDPRALLAVIGKVAEKRPEDVLDAVLFVTGDDGPGPNS
jgi:hypothetical protein